MDANDHDQVAVVSPAVVADSLLAELAGDLAKAGKAGKSRNLPGVGTVYQRGSVWWIKYSVHGKRVRESSKSTRESDAVKLLRRRIEECGKGRRRDPAAENRVKMSDLFASLEADYQAQGRRSLEGLRCRLFHLREAFGSDRAIDVTGARIARYVADRLASGAKRATVNRDLAALRRAFSLAIEREQVSLAPRIKFMEENNARQGFVTPAQFETVVAALPDYLRDLTRFGYLTGWRRGEITSLEWGDVDLDGGLITLRREQSKNKQPRTVPFSMDPADGGTIFGALGELVARRSEARMAAGDGARLVFHHHGGHGFVDFRAAWATACKAAGFPKLLFHDLRRSAVRNLMDAGVDQRVAMMITGHRTVSTFHRYRIVANDDLRAALRKIKRPDAAHGVPENGTPSGTP